MAILAPMLNALSIFAIAAVASVFPRQATAECAFASQPVPEYRELAYHVLSSEVGIDANDLSKGAGRVDVSPVDLDRDGIDEICIHAATNLTCSNGVVVCRDLLWSTKEDRVLLSTFTRRLGFAAGEHLELTNVRSEWSASDGHVYEQTFAFDGKEYASKERVLIGSRFPKLDKQ